MTEEEIREKRRKLYRKLEELVEELNAVEDIDPDRDMEYTTFPTSYVLIVGFEGNGPNVTPEGTVGSVGIYPRWGGQPAWKTAGLLDQAMTHYHK